MENKLKRLGRIVENDQVYFELPEDFEMMESVKIDGKPVLNYKFTGVPTAETGDILNCVDLSTYKHLLKPGSVVIIEYHPKDRILSRKESKL